MFRARSALDAGLDAFKKRSWKRARKHLEDAALAGERSAEYHFGLLLWRGLGGAQDREGAVYWFRRAAAQELPAAQDALGAALRSGMGAAQDREEAWRLFKLASERGYAPAMANLATMCDPVDARRWMIRAAQTGHEPSMLNLSDLIEQEEPIEALAWLYCAASVKGNETAAMRAKKLARTLSAAGIAIAQKRGRTLAKDVKAALKAEL
ncbi:MAG: hypothetical protein ABW199_03305 [Caulobacterales bacterium]